MHRTFLPSLLIAAALVAVPTIGAAAGSSDSAATVTCDATPVPTSEPATSPSSDDETDVDVDVSVSAEWDERCDIDPLAYYLTYPEFDDYDSATASPSSGTATGGAPAVTTAGAPTPDRLEVSDAAETGTLEQDAPDPQPEPGVLDDNTFVDAGQSQWIAVADDRESTFGLDVDTGSYSVAELLAAQGYQPVPDSVRPEEWVNSFEYGDVHDGAEALDVNVETSSESGADPAMLRVGISTADLATEDRPAANITVVIDTSGSMDIRERLGLAKASLALLTRNLRPDDSIAIVVYGDTATPLLPPTPVSEWRTIVDAIDGLEPGGSTNMESGLRLGYDLARESFDPEALNVVILASDGVANAGVTDADELTSEITQAGEEGIQLVTVGFGMGNYNDHLMEQLANQGDGFYSYVDTYGQAVELFVEDLTPTLTVVAKDAKVQVVFDDEIVERYRLIGYENRALDDSDFSDDSVDAGELGAGHQATAVYELDLRDDQSPAAAAAVGEVRLRWTDPQSGDVTELVSEVEIVGDAQASPTLRFAALVAHSAEYFRGDEIVTERGITTDDLIAESDELAELGVEGASEFGDFLRTAAAGQPSTDVVDYG